MVTRRAVLGGALAASAGALLTGCAAPLSLASARRRGVAVGFAQTGVEGGWRSANTTSVRQALAAAGFAVMYVDSQEQQAVQIAAIRTFITRGVDVIVFAPLVETGWRDVLLEAKAARIPVVLEDRAIEADDAALTVSRIGDDFVREGRLAGEWVAATAAGARVVQLLGTTGSSAAIDRSRGFAAATRDAGLHLLAAEDGGFTRAQGKSVMAAFLERFPDGIDVLFAQSDDMAIGAVQAIEEAGLTPGRDIRIVSIDATRDGLDLLVDGRIDHIVQCNPLLGPRVARVVRAVHEGRRVEREYIAEDRVFDAAAARKVLATWPY